MNAAPPKSWRRLLAALLASTLCLPAGAQVRLPSLGESASSDLSVGAERRLGEQIMREARRDPDFLDDPVLLEYVQSLWNPLVATARRVGNIDADTDQLFAWEIFLVRDRSVNAFALPGGFVGTHLGLIAITSTADQLASVLAHELSHVTQRHIARSIAPQKQASLMALATVLLGVLAASRSRNADAANAAIMGGQGAAIQSQLNFSRDMEREADRIGFGLLSGAGFAPAGMAAMFEKMDYATRLSDGSSFPYLRSHPLTVDRISEARNRTLLSRGAPTTPTALHAMMQWRSRVLMDDGAQALQRFDGKSVSPATPERVGVIYAGALAASLLREPARAQTLIASARQHLAAATPREPRAERVLDLLQAQVLVASAEPAAALQVLDALVPTDAERPQLLLRAQAAMGLRRVDAAAAAAPLRSSNQALQVWLAEHPLDASAWELMASTSDALGLPLRSMRAAAEARFVVGDLNGAIDRLRAAQQASRAATGPDFIEASVIDSRLRQITAQRRQLALEARGESRGRAPDDPPQ